MGWGYEPHEGYAARRLPDGSLTGSWTTDTAEFDAYVAVCGCGWRGGTFAPTEEGHEAAGADWHYGHWLRLVTPHENLRLLLRTDGGGKRHFLAGRAVYCGHRLDLLLAQAVWVPVRYETAGGEPVGYVASGGPGEALGAVDQVHFRLPADAVLRWPA